MYGIKVILHGNGFVIYFPLVTKPRDVQFGGRTQAIGKLGGGLEHRFSPTTGIFVDAAWMFADHENAAVLRAGVSLVFGPKDQPPPSYK
jgi:hypothetical protein